MVEYLDPRDGYKLVTLPDWQAPQPWWIKVPEGAEIYGYPPSSRFPYFHKTIDGQNWYYTNMAHDWDTSGHPVGAFDCIYWQRATQPEELPFIDDEPPAHFVVRPKPRERVYAELGKWSPDWSQAPEWAGWWCAIMQDGIITGGWWSTHKPETICPIGNYSCYSHHGRCEQAPSFGYSGDWKDSVTKRPKLVSA